MSDRLIRLDTDKMAGALALDDLGRMVMTDGFESAVTISLFSDRRAPDDMDLPDNSGDRRGWCLGHHEANETGSWLWLLSREKQVPAVLTKARLYAELALEWITRGKFAAKVVVETAIVADGILGLHVQIIRHDGSTWIKAYDYHWNAHVV